MRVLLKAPLVVFAVASVQLSAQASRPTQPSAPSAPQPQPAPQLPHMRPIKAEWMTRDDVARMTQAALDRCEALGQPATVSVVDAEGSLRATVTSDRARIVGIETSMIKIAAVLVFHASSRALQERAASDAVFAAQFGKDPRFLFYPGALPLYRKGALVGAIAVGGARENDEVCARAGLAAVSGTSERP